MNTKNEKSPHLGLSDFYGTAFLLASGAPILSVDKTNPRRVVFLFADNKRNQQLVEDFMFGRGQISPKRFIAAIREVKQLLYSSL